MSTPRVLFILKRREDYNSVTHNHIGLSTGLYNSASFVVDMLNDSGIEAILEVAVDNNCIDRMVTKHRPTHVIIEALWVVPSKFTVLTKLHPTVKWVIRLHSEMPFMAGEGMAMDWLGDYIKFPQISIGINAPRMLNEIRTYLATVDNLLDHEIEDRVVYMPNFYPQTYKTKKFLPTGKYKGKKYWIDIACFGAIRPLKNHMEQAVAAVKFANKHQLQLRFHVNSGRIEMQGSPALHNLRGFFQHLNGHGHQLINHEWTPRDQFLELCATMDIGLQCNFSETFNIVSADLISQGVPIVGSEEIPWAFHTFNAKPAFSDDIAEKIEETYKKPRFNVWIHQKQLTRYTNKTRKIWSKYFRNEMNK